MTCNEHRLHTCELFAALISHIDLQSFQLQQNLLIIS